MIALIIKENDPCFNEILPEADRCELRAMNRPENGKITWFLNFVL